MGKIIGSNYGMGHLAVGVASWRLLPFSKYPTRLSIEVLYDGAFSIPIYLKKKKSAKLNAKCKANTGAEAWGKQKKKVSMGLRDGAFAVTAWWFHRRSVYGVKGRELVILQWSGGVLWFCRKVTEAEEWIHTTIFFPGIPSYCKNNTDLVFMP